MKTPLLIALYTVLTLAAGCRESTMTHDTSEATIASETGGTRQVPNDVLHVTHSLIAGELYSRPSFNGISVARFDTSHQIQVLDTTDQLFVKARIVKDTTAFMGYVSRAILPEKD